MPNRVRVLAIPDADLVKLEHQARDRGAPAGATQRGTPQPEARSDRRKPVGQAVSGGASRSECISALARKQHSGVGHARTETSNRPRARLQRAT
jgi:hypothetical protein